MPERGAGVLCRRGASPAPGRETEGGAAVLNQVVFFQAPPSPLKLTSEISNFSKRKGKKNYTQYTFTIHFSVHSGALSVFTLCATGLQSAFVSGPVTLFLDQLPSLLPHIPGHQPGPCLKLLNVTHKPYGSLKVCSIPWVLAYLQSWAATASQFLRIFLAARKETRTYEQSLPGSDSH